MLARVFAARRLSARSEDLNHSASTVTQPINVLRDHTDRLSQDQITRRKHVDVIKYQITKPFECHSAICDQQLDWWASSSHVVVVHKHRTALTTVQLRNFHPCRQSQFTVSEITASARVLKELQNSFKLYASMTQHSQETQKVAYAVCRQAGIKITCREDYIMELRMDRHASNNSSNRLHDDGKTTVSIIKTS